MEVPYPWALDLGALPREATGHAITPSSSSPSTLRVPNQTS